MSAALGQSLQEILVTLITDFVTEQQLQCGCQQGALGLVSHRRSGRWVGYCWPDTSPAGEHQTWAGFVLLYLPAMQIYLVS